MFPSSSDSVSNSIRHPRDATSLIPAAEVDSYLPGPQEAYFVCDISSGLDRLQHIRAHLPNAAACLTEGPLKECWR
jgi:hypothetical protein